MLTTLFYSLLALDQIDRRAGGAVRTLALRAAVPRDLRRDRARRVSVPARRLDPVHLRHRRRDGRTRRARAGRRADRGRDPRRHRQLLGRALHRTEGVRPARFALVQAGAPAADAGVLRQVRRRHDHHRPLRADHPHVRAVSRRRRRHALPEVPGVQRGRRRRLDHVARLRRLPVRQHPVGQGQPDADRHRHRRRVADPGGPRSSRAPVEAARKWIGATRQPGTPSCGDPAIAADIFRRASRAPPPGRCRSPARAPSAAPWPPRATRGRR